MSAVYDHIISLYKTSQIFINDLLRNKAIKLKDIPPKLRINETNFYNIAYYLINDVSEYNEIIEIIKSDLDYCVFEYPVNSEKINLMLINYIEEAKLRYSQNND
jgi:hypothetical protein